MEGYEEVMGQHCLERLGFVVEWDGGSKVAALDILHG